LNSPRDHALSLSLSLSRARARVGNFWIPVSTVKLARFAPRPIGRRPNTPITCLGCHRLRTHASDCVRAHFTEQCLTSDGQAFLHEHLSRSKLDCSEIFELRGDMCQSTFSLRKKTEFKLDKKARRHACIFILCLESVAREVCSITMLFKMTDRSPDNLNKFE